jgi:hypothetical protein
MCPIPRVLERSRDRLPPHPICAVPSNAGDLPYRWPSAAVSVRGQFVVATSGQILMAAHTRRHPDTAGSKAHTTGILNRKCSPASSSLRSSCGGTVAKVFRRVRALSNALNNALTLRTSRAGWRWVFSVDLLSEVTSRSIGWRSTSLRVRRASPRVAPEPLSHPRELLVSTAAGRAIATRADAVPYAANRVGFVSWRRWSWVYSSRR